MKISIALSPTAAGAQRAYKKKIRSKTVKHPKSKDALTHKNIQRWIDTETFWDPTAADTSKDEPFQTWSRSRSRLSKRAWVYKYAMHT